MINRNRILCDAESRTEISGIAERLLKKTGLEGIIPTPIEELIKSANIVEVADTENALQSFLSALKKSGKSFLNTLVQKVRGMADLREQAIFIKSDKPFRERWAKTHELGHQALPWHRTEDLAGYADDNYTLSPSVRDMFDIEANQFSSEVIFQGAVFTERVRNYRPTLSAAFHLAQEFIASKESTLRRFVEVHDDILVAIRYLPTKYKIDLEGQEILQSPWFFTSKSFTEKYGEIGIPEEITSGHPWPAARQSGTICDGEILLNCLGVLITFNWESWWNGYSLQVLLRKKPILSLHRASK